MWKRIILAKYNQNFVGEILKTSKFSSLKAPWRSIIKGIDWFLPQTRWTIMVSLYPLGMVSGLTISH